MGWYSYDRMMSYNALFNFIISNRGGGKSYGAKKRVIKNFLKTGEQFIYVRRYKTELKKKQLFFDDVGHEFPNNKLEVKGSEMFIDGKKCGYFMALSTSQQEKSTAYPLVTTILFDEFIVDKGHIRYMTNEVEVFLDLFETVNRMSNRCKAIFMANNVSLVNPYFLYFNCIPRNNERFTVSKGGEVIVEMFTDDEFIKQKKLTRFGKLIDGTAYADFNIENKSLRDKDTFIQKFKPKNSKFLFSIKFRGKESGIWISYDEGLCYVCDSIQPSSKFRFTVTKDDHDVNYIMYDKLGKFMMFQEFVKYYRLGYVRFKDVSAKSEIFEILQFMNIR